MIKKLLIAFLCLFFLSQGALAALTLDGSNGASGSFTSTNTATVALTTTGTNDIINVNMITTGVTLTVTGISDTAGLTWVKRKALAVGATTNIINSEFWYAKSTGALTADTITVTMNITSTAGWRLDSWGINGANFTTPFDTNASFPAFNTASSAGTSLAVTGLTTNQTNDVLVSSLRTQAAMGTLTRPSGFTQIINTTSTDNAYNVLSGTLSSATETFSWVNSVNTATLIVDAIQPATGGGPPSQNGFWFGQ